MFNLTNFEARATTLVAFVTLAAFIASLVA
jgi:hypothetical protein